MSNCRAVKGNRNKIAFLIVRTKVPIATVHPYDGEAALSGLARVAARGVRRGGPARARAGKEGGRIGCRRADGQCEHPPGRQRNLVPAFEKLDLTAEEKEKNRVGNARRLFSR